MLLIAIGLALLFGIAIAVSPLEFPLIVLAVGGLGLLGLLTPWVPLSALLILAPLRTLIATESPFVLPIDLGQILFATLGLFWIAHRIIRSRTLPRLRWTWFYIPLLGFIAITALSAFAAQSITSWLSEWLKWIQIAILVALCLDIASGRAWERLVFILTIAAVGNAIIGIYQYFGGSGALHLLINEVHFRAFGTFGQPNPFGAFMGLIAPLSLAAAIGYLLRVWSKFRATGQFDTDRLLLALFYGLCTAVISAALIFSYSRGAWLGFGLAVSALIALAPHRLSAGLLIMAVIGLVGATLWVSGRLPASIVDRIRSATEETLAISDVRGVNITPDNYALIERLAHWQAAVAMANAHPWFGVGFGNYENVYPSFRLLNWEFPLGHAHNYYLNVLAETGMIGLAAYVVLWISYFGIALRLRHHPDPLFRLMAAGLFASGVYIAVHSLTDNVYVNNLFLHIGVVIGLLSVLHNQVRPHAIMETS
jgi:O-antigen ligase